MTPSLEGWPTKAKEAPSPHEARLTPLDTNQVLQYLEEILMHLVDIAYCNMQSISLYHKTLLI